MQTDVRYALNVLKNRRSCRQFADRPIEQEVLNEILEVGIRAASGGNLQPVSMVVVREKDKKKEIRKLCGQGFIEQADTLIVFILDLYRLKRWADVQKAPFGFQHTIQYQIIAMEDLMCMAQSVEAAANLLGIGNVYIGTVNYHYEALKKMLDLPELTVPVLMTCLGYPKAGDSEQGHLRKKLAQDIVVHCETYKKLSDNDVRERIVTEKYDNWLNQVPEMVLDKYKETLYEAASKANDKDWAKEVIAAVDEQRGINRAQYRFGLHYNPVKLKALNKQQVDFYRKQGFTFWSEIELKDDKND